MSLLSLSEADAKRFWSHVEKTDGCWNWRTRRGLAPYAYGQARLFRRPLGAHRLSYMMHVGEVPQGLQVCHRCDNPRCVRPDHLFLGTIGDNMRDRTAKGRQARGQTHGWALHPERVVRGDRHWSKRLKDRVPRGERNGFATLTEADVIAIREAYAAGRASQNELARQYNTAQANVWRIIHRRAWQHVA